MHLKEIDSDGFSTLFGSSLTFHHSDMDSPNSCLKKSVDRLNLRFFSRSTHWYCCANRWVLQSLESTSRYNCFLRRHNYPISLLNRVFVMETFVFELTCHHFGRVTMSMEWLKIENDSHRFDSSFSAYPRPLHIGYQSIVRYIDKRRNCRHSYRFHHSYKEH